MIDCTKLGVMTQRELVDQLAQVTGNLESRIRELGGLTQDKNNDWYPAYFQAPANSVAAKEREAEFKCLPMINDMGMLQAEIDALTTIRDCIIVIIRYAR